MRWSYAEPVLKHSGKICGTALYHCLVVRFFNQRLRDGNSNSKPSFPEKTGCAEGLQPTHVKIPRATETTRKCNRYFLRPRDKSQVEEVTSSNDSATATIRSLYMKGSDESHKEVGVRIRGVLTAKHITRVGTYNVRTANSCGKLAQSESECKCAIKNQLEVSLVYCTNQTKRLMEKPKRKPLSSPVSVKAVRWKGWSLWRGRI